MALLLDFSTQTAILVCAIIGIAYSCFLWWFIKRRVEQGIRGEVKLGCARMKREIAKGVKAFLLTEYPYVGGFLVVYAILIFLCLGSVESHSSQSRPCIFDPSKMCKPALTTAVVGSVSFLLGAFTSALSGFLGMQIAIFAYVRTASAERKGVGEVFIAAFMSGAVMGFLLAADGLLLLYIAISLFKVCYGNDWEGLSEAIAGYGLGGSSMALFGRAGRGIYAKAANVYLHFLVYDLKMQPIEMILVVIADNVGAVVSDIAGTWIDLFGSYIEASCAALVVGSISSFGIDHNSTAICYPLLICAMGILVCLITTLFMLGPSEIKEPKDVKPKLEKQLMISTILMTVGIFIVSWIALPSSFTIYNFGSQMVVKKWQLASCVGVGLWAGLAIGFFNKLCTEDAFRDIRDAITTIPILGLFLGKIPIFAAISVYVSYSFASFYGIALAAVGMLSTVATRSAIDVYCPISHNAKRIAEDPDDAGNSAAAIGKLQGFGIESAALVSVALFGAFVSRAAIPSVDVLTPKVFIGLIVGVVLPYLFYYMTMNSVGSAAFEMANETFRTMDKRRQQLQCFNYLDYIKPASGSTRASIRGTIGPVALVTFAPLMIGYLFGVETLSGILAGSLGSVVRIAIWASSDEGRSKEKESILASISKATRTLPPDSVIRMAAEDGHPGIPRKNASGPPLNNLIQVMAVQMLVFAPFLTSKGGLLLKNSLS